MKPTIKKSHTTHYAYLKTREDTVYIDVSNEVPDHMCVYDIEPGRGVLSCYGSKKQLIAELRELIEILEAI